MNNGINNNITTVENNQLLKLDESAINGIATLVTTYLISSLRLDSNPMYFGMLQPIVRQLLQNLLSHDLGNYMSPYLNYLSIYNVAGMMAAYLLYTNFNKIYEYIIPKSHNSDTLTLNVYTDKDIRTFTEYIKHHRSFYDIPGSVDLGDIDMMYNSGRTAGTCSTLLSSQKTSDDIYISFNDTNFNVTGKYMWTKSEIKIDDDYTKKEKILKIPHLIIEINRTSELDAVTYFEKITEKIDEMTHDHMVQYYVKMYKDKNATKISTSIVYTGKKRSLEMLEHLYIDPFFHKEKDVLWNLIKTIEFNPTEIYETGQIPRLGLLLYGDPGTGKSSFAFRIAMALKRHIVSLDLLDINNKNEIFDLMRNPKIGHTVYRPKDVLFIFDEFDRTIFSILGTTKYQKKKIYVEEAKDIKDIKDLKDKKEDDKKDNFIEVLEQTTLMIEDLQEIIQGAIPLENAIIIATTNRYDELKEKCPALFRVGRLTPVKFENADMWFINEVSKRFFNKDVKLNVQYKNNIQPSAIIEYAIKYSNKYYDNGYELFVEQVEQYIGQL